MRVAGSTTENMIFTYRQSTKVVLVGGKSMDGIKAGPRDPAESALNAPL